MQQNRNSLINHYLVHLTASFLFGFIFIFINYAGLPIDFHADYVNDSLKSLETTTPLSLLKRTLNPLTPGWFYPPNGMMEHMRPLQILMFHIFHKLVPFSLVPFHISAAVGYGLLAVILFYIIAYWTKKSLYGWLAVVLYASFPSNFFIMTSITSFDFQYYVSIFSLAILVLLFTLTSGTLKKNTSICMFVLPYCSAKIHLSFDRGEKNRSFNRCYCTDSRPGCSIEIF